MGYPAYLNKYLRDNEVQHLKALPPTYAMPHVPKPQPRDTSFDRCKQCRTYQKNHAGRDHDFVPKIAAAGSPVEPDTPEEGR